MYKSIMLVLVLFLFGCTNTKEVAILNCDGDWKQIGLNTAQEGKPVRTFDDYVAACGKKAEAGKSAYLDGYARGIIVYCSKNNGFAIGFKNLEMPQVCPYELRSEFVKGYELGLAEFKRKMDQYKDLVQQHERDLERNLFNEYNKRSNNHPQE